MEDYTDIEKKRWYNIAQIEPPDRSKEYYSCNYIEGGLVFLEGWITACCFNFSKGGSVKLSPFTGGHVPVSKILLKRKEMIRLNQSEGYPGCKGCPHLIKQIWEPKKWFFDLPIIAHFTSCNLSCYYCYSTPKKRQKMSAAKIIPLMDTFKDLIKNDYLSPKGTLSWGGGEPTILKEFDSLFKLLTDYGLNSHICTNGTIFSKSIYDALKNKKVMLNISVDSGSEAVFKKIKSKDLFNTLWTNIEAYAKANPYRILLKYILLKENIHDVLPFLERAKKTGVKRISYDIDVNEKEISDTVLNAAALMKYHCEKLGLEAVMGEVGASFWQDRHHVENRIQEAYKGLKKTNSICPWQTVYETDTARIWIDDLSYDDIKRVYAKVELPDAEGEHCTFNLKKINAKRYGEDYKGLIHPGTYHIHVYIQNSHGDHFKIAWERFVTSEDRTFLSFLLDQKTTNPI